VLAGAAGAVIAVCLALLIGFGKLGGTSGSRAVEIDWPAGVDSEEAAALLETAGLIDNHDAMAIFLRTTGGTASFVPGPHLIPQGKSPWQIRQLLSRSPERPMARVVLPEGFHRFDIADRLEKLGVTGRRAFLRASADPTLIAELAIDKDGSAMAESAEGYLFPATYDLHVDSDPADLVRRLVTESDRRWATLAAKHKDGLASLGATLGWGRREVITLASMVEKEAAVDEERPVIASVFLNRLLNPEFRPKRLQSDPTSTYGCLAFPEEAPSCAGFQGKSTPAINQDPNNRYSTYVRERLPPGPIANPGAASIAAVLAPAATKYLYFVASGGGRHSFTEDLASHNEAVRKLRAASQ
jgi:UPF0755 protein